MDGYDSLFSPMSGALDEAPLDLIFAQHNLQKLNLVSQQNRGSMRDCIAYQLDSAEEVLTGSHRHEAAAKYLAQIAEARQRLVAGKH